MQNFFLGLMTMIVGLSVNTSAQAETIYDVREKRPLTRYELLTRLETVDEVIVGEKHNTPKIQSAQARLLDEWVSIRGKSFTFAWEFLNWSEREKIETAFVDFTAGRSDGAAFLQTVFASPTREASYLPLLNVTARLGGQLMATNLSRAEKAPVVRGGIAALDPALLPPDFEMGSENYRARFIEAMGGHGGPAMDNYFAAQSLVDDVVAYHLTNDVSTELAFLVIGDFHTSYFDGTYARLQARAPAKSRILVHISDRSDYRDDEWETILHHPVYGDIADVVIFAD